MYRRGLRRQVLVELVALDLALLEIHRQIQAESAQSAEAVQLVLLAGQAVADLDVTKIDRRLLMRRLARRRAHQLLVVHGVVLLELIALRKSGVFLSISHDELRTKSFRSRARISSEYHPHSAKQERVFFFLVT